MPELGIRPREIVEAHLPAAVVLADEREAGVGPSIPHPERRNASPGDTPVVPGVVPLKEKEKRWP